MIKKDLVPILINSYENIDVFSAVIRSGKISKLMTDMRLVNNFTPPDFQAKNFTPLISPNFNSCGDNNTNT